MKFEIEKGVPVPRPAGKPIKYDIPLKEMKKGDHIMVDMPKSKITSDVKILRNMALRFTHKNPSYKFTVRQMDDGVGIWRV
tara:strand:+ start:2093 stop:2335 length:243 start_codon:yes stop_codon:yes gene_type:complete